MEANLTLQEMQLQLERGLSQLPAKACQIYLLSRDQHQSNRDINHQMQLSEKAVEYYITKVLKSCGCT